MAALKRKQSGSTTMSTTSKAVTVSTYIDAQSILIFSCEGGGQSEESAYIQGTKTSTTTVTFFRDASGGDDPVIEWVLLEFDADTDVQQFDEQGTGTKNSTISSVDTALSYVIGGGVSCPNSYPNGTSSAIFEITTSTNVKRTAGTFGSATWYGYQVVEQQDIESIQFITRTNDTTATTQNETISSVTMAQTFLYGSGKGDDNFHENDEPFNLELTSTTNLQFTRSGIGDWDSACYVVEFPTTVKVQRGSVSVTNDTDVTITAVKVENSFPMTGVAHNNWMVNCSVASPDARRSNIVQLVETATKLNLSRSSNNNIATAKWQVWEFDPEALTTVEDNETPTEITGTDGATGDHTIDAGTNRILFVAVGTVGTSNANTAVSCTYDGVAMTTAHTKVSQSGANVRATVFYMLETDLPTSGSHEVDVTTPTGTAQHTHVIVYSLQNLKQTGPEQTADAASTSTVTEVETFITTINDRAVIVDALIGNDSAFDVDEGTGMIQQGHVNGADEATSSGYRETGLAEAYPMSWVWGPTMEAHAHVLVSFEEATPGLVDIAGVVAGVATVAGDIEVDVELEAASDGVATVAGAMNVKTDLVGQSDGDTTIVAGCVGTIRITTQSDGLSDVAGMLDVKTMIDAQSDGVCTVAASLTLPVVLSGGDIAGVATVVGAMRVLTDLAGQSDGVATVTANLKTGLVAKVDGSTFISASLGVKTRLAASVVGQSTVVAGPLIGIFHHSGQSDGVATVTGAMDVLSEIISLEAQSDGSSTVVADGALFQIDTQLLVGVPGQTSIVATMAPRRSIQALVSGLSSVEGTLDVKTDVAAQSDGTTSLAAELGVSVRLAAAVAGSSAVIGALDGKIADLVAAIVGGATVSGSLDVATALASAVTGVGTVQGSLAVQTALQALTAGLSAVEAELLKTQGIAGQADGVATVAGTLVALRGVEAAVVAGAGASGDLEVLTALQAAVTGVATVQAAMDIIAEPLTAQVTGASIVQGVLNVLTALEASAAGDSTVVAELDRLLPLVGQSDGVATVVADMLNIVSPEGQADGVAAVAAALEVLKSLDALVQGQSVPAPAVEVLTALVAESLGLSTPSGTLIVAGLGLGPVVSRGRARVSGDLSVISFKSSHSQSTDPRIITRRL